MEISKVIIHELSKSVGASGAKLSKSNSLMESTNLQVMTLVNELNKRYRNWNEKQGVFDINNPTDFHTSFTKYHSINNDEAFIEFTQHSAENLRHRIEGISGAKGGYLAYADYFDYRNYCAVFFVRDTTGMAFKRNKSIERFDLNKVPCRL